jgi:hypothetical protein
MIILLSMVIFPWQAIQSYRAESDTELNLAAGDYIVVRKVVLSHRVSVLAP